MIKAEVEGCGGLVSLGFGAGADGVGVVEALLCEGVEVSDCSEPLFFFFAMIN